MFDVTDGTSNTIAIVEVEKSGINWAEPRDVDLSQPQAAAEGALSGGKPGRFTWMAASG